MTQPSITNMRCATCRFWRADEDKHNSAIDARRCVYPAFAPDATKWDEDYENQTLVEDAEDKKAFVTDASGYRATFCTNANFCCNQYQERR